MVCSNCRMKVLVLMVVIMVMGIVLSGCIVGFGDDGGDGQMFKFWYYESFDSVMGKVWDEVICVFEKEIGVIVEFEEKFFEQIQKIVSQVFDMDVVFDLMEFNKGNVMVGFFVLIGLIFDIFDVVEEYGWDDKFVLFLQIMVKYFEDGVMGGDIWFGVLNYGEFVGVYYNEDVFVVVGFEILIMYEEFVDVFDVFVVKGIILLVEVGVEYFFGQFWYQFVFLEGDCSFVDVYQFYDGEVDWQGFEVMFVMEMLKDYVDKGYIVFDVFLVKVEDVGVLFINGILLIFVFGFWWFGWFVVEVIGFDWSMIVFFGVDFFFGFLGNFWVVLENVVNKELVYEFIDIMMCLEIQVIIGNNGGLFVVVDIVDIIDEKSVVFIDMFNGVFDVDGLLFYLDWFVFGFYDVIVQELQGLVIGVQDVEIINVNFGEQYDEGIVEFC